MANRKNRYSMKKRGQFIEFLGILFVIGIIIVGTTGVYLTKDKVYVGDIENNELYKYSECRDFIKNLNEDSLTVYDSKERAEQDGFKLTDCKK